MRFSIFESARAQRGELCTYDKYVETANAWWLLRLCNAIAAETDKDKRSELKKRLPVITWQAYFPGKRLIKEAEPSGLFMLDIDHVEEPGKLYAEKVASRVQELGIVYVGMTASRHGLRIVARCLPTLRTIEDCQRWLASSLKVEYDGVCKDFARCSFLVHDSYTYYMDCKAIWQEDAAEGTIYDTKAPVQENVAFNEALLNGNFNFENAESPEAEEVRDATDKGAKENTPIDATADQREGLFGQSNEYKGVPYERIIKEWFDYTGGEPAEGERNVRLYQLALRLRYITDFNEATMVRIMPTYGLPVNEVKQLVHSAVTTTRASRMQKDLEEVLARIDKQIKLTETNEEANAFPEEEIITDTEKMPSLPPVFRQWAEIAPSDFRAAVTLCQLPILGALGSRLRAVYLDGKVHSPSFQVSLEAPQASGKSFLVKLVESELKQMMEDDEAQREKERAYADKVSEMKMLNIKINADNKDEILGTKPQGIVRYLPPTMSITKLLMRLHAAGGLHVFSLSEEIDTVYRAQKRQFSSMTEMYRVAFDNGLFGQDYASDNSFSGNVRLYYNTLFSGTPKAMRRFYPDVEDGLVSRVLFCTLPDQFGKPMPVWGEFDAQQKQIVDIGLTRLNEITLVNGEVQQEHMMKLDFVNAALKTWIQRQQAQAVKDDDRTRDIFCRRAAVVGFRASMLAWFLWNEKSTPTIRKNVAAFAIWVANNMLNQHLLRFTIKGTGSNVNQWEELYAALPDSFTRKELETQMDALGVNSKLKDIVYKWRLLGVIRATDVGRTGNRNKMTTTKFEKVKQ